MTDHSPRQLELALSDPGMTPDALAAFLTGGARRPVRLTLTRNRASMASVAFPADGPVVLRLHRAFLAAPPRVLDDLRLYLRTRHRAAWRTVAAYARNIRPDPAALRRRPALPAVGAVYDLTDIFRGLNREFFRNRLNCRIGWGKMGRPARRRRSRRSVRFGSWNHADRLIRIHPLLDDRRVPPEFVRYIVFHEMLHAVVPEQRVGQRRRIHPREFKTLEKRFPGHSAMQTLASQLLRRLARER